MSRCFSQFTHCTFLIWRVKRGHRPFLRRLCQWCNREWYVTVVCTPSVTHLAFQVNTSKLVFDKLCHEGLSTHYVSSVLKILYPDAVKHNNYSKTLTSVAFAGTFVGMLIFGWISDKIGRKFGMVRTISGTSDAHLRMGLSLPRCLLLESLLSFLPSLRPRPALTIVPPASLLCSVHVGRSANDISPLLEVDPRRRAIVSSSVSALVQNILVDPSQPLSSPRKKELQRMLNTGGLR
jgi:MFS family permease